MGSVTLLSPWRWWPYGECNSPVTMTVVAIFYLESNSINIEKRIWCSAVCNTQPVKVNRQGPYFIWRISFDTSQCYSTIARGQLADSGMLIWYLGWQDVTKDMSDKIFILYDRTNFWQACNNMTICWQYSIVFQRILRLINYDTTTLFYIIHNSQEGGAVFQKG